MSLQPVTERIRQRQALLASGLGKKSPLGLPEYQAQHLKGLDDSDPTQNIEEMESFA